VAFSVVEGVLKEKGGSSVLLKGKNKGQAGGDEENFTLEIRRKS